MLLTTWLVGQAFGGFGCTDRITVAPLATGLSLLPLGGSVRLDHAIACPSRGGDEAIAVSIDLGAFVPMHEALRQDTPAFRQQIGIDFTPPTMRPRGGGGAYGNVRLGVIEAAMKDNDHTEVLVVPGAVAGYRVETHGGVVAQFGIGLEIWPEEWMPAISAAWPAIEVRVGGVIARRHRLEQRGRSAE